MKLSKKFILFAFFSAVGIGKGFSQAPQIINYQAVARYSSGAVMSNQTIGVKFDFHYASPTGPSLYIEKHGITTNDYGLFTLPIGLGTQLFGTFAGINWANGPIYMEVLIDSTGLSGYTSMGTTQILSVPYALYAEKSKTNLKVDSTEVFNGLPPLVWTDLTLSAVVGNNPAFVVLKVTNLGTTFVNFVAFRQKGDNSEYFTATTPTGANKGALPVAGTSCMMIVNTNQQGVIQWISSQAEPLKVEVVSFIK